MLINYEKVNIVKKKLKILPAAFLLLSTSAYGMNLTEALSSTYQTNKQLAAARQTFLVEIESFSEALASFLPDVSAQYTSTSTKSKRFSEHARGATASEAGPDGTKSIRVTQEIFSGGSSMYGLKSAQSGFWVSRSKLYGQEQEILTKATESYLNVAEAKAKYNIALDSLEFHEKTLHMIEEKLKVGEATITEVSLARSNVASAQAGKSQQYAELLGSKAAFKTMTNMEATDDMTFPEIPDNIPENLAEFEGRVFKTNLELIAAKHSMMQSKDSANAAKGALLPKANLQFQARKDHFRDEQANQVFQTSERQKKLTTSTSLVIDVPIFSKGGAAYSKIRKSNKAARHYVYLLDQKEREVQSSIIATWESYIASKDSIDFSEKHVEYQKLALDGVRQEYEVGAKTMIDVLKTQEDYNKAKVQAVEVKKKYILSAYRIKSLMGTMLAQNLKLKVDYFSPEKEFRHVKYKIIGF